MRQDMTGRYIFSYGYDRPTISCILYIPTVLLSLRLHPWHAFTNLGTASISSVGSMELTQCIPTASRYVNETIDPREPVTLSTSPDSSILLVGSTWFAFATVDNRVNVQTARSQESAHWTVSSGRDAPLRGCWRLVQEQWPNSEPPRCRPAGVSMCGAGFCPTSTGRPRPRPQDDGAIHHILLRQSQQQRARAPLYRAHRDRSACLRPRKFPPPPPPPPPPTDRRLGLSKVPRRRHRPPTGASAIPPPSTAPSRNKVDGNANRPRGRQVQPTASRPFKPGPDHAPEGHGRTTASPRSAAR